MAFVISTHTLYCITRFVEDYQWKAVECNRDLVRKYPTISPRTLYAIRAMVDQKIMISNVGKLKSKHCELGKSIREEFERQPTPGVMEKYGKIYNVPPFTISRLVVDSLTGGNKKRAAALLKETSLLEDKDLAYEIYLSSIMDPFSPLNDCRKHISGLEYEHELQMILRQHNIGFLSEKDLRLGKCLKTPDALLELPISANGFAFSWIESKALFADEAIHTNFFNEQYKGYCDLYGPGMVIYWSGFVETVPKKYSDKLLVVYEFPRNIVKIDKTMLGESMLTNSNAL